MRAHHACFSACRPWPVEGRPEWRIRAGGVGSSSPKGAGACPGACPVFRQPTHCSNQRAGAPCSRPNIDIAELPPQTGIGSRFSIYGWTRHIKLQGRARNTTSSIITHRSVFPIPNSSGALVDPSTLLLVSLGAKKPGNKPPELNRRNAQMPNCTKKALKCHSQPYPKPKNKPKKKNKKSQPNTQNAMSHPGQSKPSPNTFPHCSLGEGSRM